MHPHPVAKLGHRVAMKGHRVAMQGHRVGHRLELVGFSVLALGVVIGNENVVDLYASLFFGFNFTYFKPQNTRKRNLIIFLHIHTITAMSTRSAILFTIALGAQSITGLFPTCRG